MRESPGGPSTTGLVAAHPARPQLGAGRAARRGIVVRRVRRADDRGWQRSHRVGVRALRRDDGRPGFPGPGGRAAERWSPVVPDPGGYGRGVAAVLLVEDDETIGRVLAASLGVHGHAAVWVTTGAAGLAAAAER